MSSEPVVSVRDVGKTYYIYDTPRDALFRQIHTFAASSPGLPGAARRWLRGRAEGHGRPFDALQGVTFDVGRGESLGIIGRNGSGKSTLLQIVAGTLTPTSGRVDVSGRVAALLELGSGFNPEFTGRENLLLNGMILGAGPEEMRDRLPEIVGFAEIGEFLDQPVKTYSSGMVLRLAFAVQISLVPDVLIVDEALSVGDIFFAQKCARRIKELQSRGTTILFVSHDMSLVRDLCDRAIYLHHGQVRYLGPNDRAIALYLRSGSDEGAMSNGAAAAIGDEGASGLPVPLDAAPLWRRAGAAAAGGETGQLISVSVLDAEGRPTTSAVLGERITFRVVYQSLGEKLMHVAVVLKNRYDQVIFSGGSYTHQLAPPPLPRGEYGCFDFEVTCAIEAGQYTFQVALGLAGAPNRGVRIDETPWLGPLRVTWDYDAAPAPFHGLFGLPSVGRFRAAGAVAPATPSGQG